MGKKIVAQLYIRFWIDFTFLVKITKNYCFLDNGVTLPDIGKVDIADFPFQASLRAFDKHLCGAVIIGHNTLLTAAHCTLL